MELRTIHAELRAGLGPVHAKAERTTGPLKDRPGNELSQRAIAAAGESGTSQAS